MPTDVTDDDAVEALAVAAKDAFGSLDIWVNNAGGSPIQAPLAELGDYLIGELRKIDSPLILEIRGRGLFVGMEIDPALGTARAVCEALMERGLLSKETHETVVRLAPPLVIGKQDIDWALQQIREVLAEMDRLRLAS